MRAFFFTFLCIINITSIMAYDPGPFNAIYGKDDRKLSNNFSSRKIKEFSQSIGFLIDKSSLVQINNDHFEINSFKQSDPNGLNICADQKFANLNTINGCSGFLSSADEFITAGHCFLNQNDCENKVVIFNFKKNIFSKKIKIAKNDVYQCQKIIDQFFDAYLDYDYAQIKLDRNTNRNFLKLSKNKPNNKDQLVMIGFPLGQPMTVAKSSEIVFSSFETFDVKIDSFQGNSGSPLINLRTSEVVGILSRGQEDFIFNEERQCLEHFKVPENSTSFEKFTSSQLLTDKLSVSVGQD